MSNGQHRQYVQQFDSIGPTLAGANLPWLAARRRTALAQFDVSGFPSPRDEEWKYTNVSAIEKKLFRQQATADLPSRIDPGLIDRYRLTDAWALVFVNGIFSPELSDIADLPAGVTATPMSRALAEMPQPVERAFGQACAHEHHGFVAFNTAFFGEGLFLCVPADCVLDRPVQLLQVSTQNDTAANLRNLIVLDAGAQATLIEIFVGQPGNSTLTTSVTEVLVAENASLDCYSLQNEADRGFLFGGLYASVGPSGRFDHTNLSLGGLLVRQEIHADLGEAAQCNLNGLFLGRQRQHVDNHTLIHHRAPRGTSREHYRGILSDRARGVFQGRIVVHPDAQKTDAQMNNRNLLLSDDAEIDTKPQLEIHADDVKCAHGVAIGQLDPQSVFYLESRGVDSESARNMLTFAFANAMVEQIRLPSVKSLAQDELLALFPQAGIRKDWL